MEGKMLLCCASLLAISTIASAESFVEATYGSARAHESSYASSGSAWGLGGRYDLGLTKTFVTVAAGSDSLSDVHPSSFPFESDTTGYGFGTGYAFLSTKDVEAAVTLGYLHQESSVSNGYFGTRDTTSDAAILGLTGYKWFNDRVKGFAGFGLSNASHDTTGYSYDAGVEFALLPSVRLLGSYSYVHNVTSQITVEEGVIAGGAKIPFGKS